MEIVKFERVHFKYDPEELTWVINDSTVSFKKGSFVAVLGRNGSGKSTFARLMNALLKPQQGKVLVDGHDTANAADLWEIRRKAGMVFQNPDNQIVCTVVEEDVAFGLENIGVEPEKIRKRVTEALETVGLTEYRNSAPYMLSGGQKQRVAIAGLLAMRPECIIFDEATAMLDPIGREEMLEVVHRLNREENLTVILITHHMNEALDADRVLIFEEGRIVIDGPPAEVFTNVDQIREIGLDVPQVVELFYELKKGGIELPLKIKSMTEATEILSERLGK